MRRRARAGPRRGERLVLAEEQVGEGERVDALVERRAAAVHGVPEPVAGIAHREPERRREVPRLADRPVGEQFRDAADGRIEAHPHRLHEEDAAVPGERDELLRLGRVHRERLLEQHGRAVLDRATGELGVAVVGRRDVHEVEVVATEQAVDGLGVRDAALLGEGAGAGRVATGDRDEVERVDAAEVGDDHVGHPAGSDDADAEAGVARHGATLADAGPAGASMGG